MADLNIEVDSFQKSFISLLQGGVPIKTFIDIGCADGSFGLCCLFLKRDIHVLNIDANSIFESSLKEIEDNLGIPYRIIALSAHEGKLSMVDQPNNLYGFQVAKDQEDNERKKYINCTTLDNLLNKFNFPEPYFIKMDIENNEFNVLQGAEKTLSKTAAILFEQHVYGGRKVGDFLDKCNYLARRAFSLFDIREISYKKYNLNLNAINIKTGPDSNPIVLSTFHPIFINDKFDFRHMRDKGIDSSKETYEMHVVKQIMENRRSRAIESNRQLIPVLSSLDQ